MYIREGYGLVLTAERRAVIYHQSPKRTGFLQPPEDPPPFSIDWSFMAVILKN